MDVPSHSSDTWRHVATVEVFDRTQALDALIADHYSTLRFLAADKSPSGHAWVDVFVDASMGQRRIAVAVSSFLRAMSNEHAAGRLEGLRILNGQHWVSVTQNEEDAASYVDANMLRSAAGAS